MVKKTTMDQPQLCDECVDLVNEKLKDYKGDNLVALHCQHNMTLLRCTTKDDVITSVVNLIGPVTYKEAVSIVVENYSEFVSGGLRPEDVDLH